jgi:hypothetical protein
MTKYLCRKCEWEGPESDLIVVCTSHATLECPEEYENRCPCCKSDNVEELDDFFCDTCGDVLVRNEGDRCSECETVRTEAIFGAWEDDLLH